MFQFSNVVVVDDDQIGVIVKKWHLTGNQESRYKYDVYVRSYNEIREYGEEEIKHFVFSKFLHEDEYGFYNKG